MNNKDSHYRPIDGLVEADVPHPQVAKLAENSVARRHARSFRLPMDALTAGVGSLQRQTFDYAIMFSKQRKARGQDHEPLADRFAREERRAAALPKTLPRSGTP